MNQRLMKYLLNLKNGKRNLANSYTFSNENEYKSQKWLSWSLQNLIIMHTYIHTHTYASIFEIQWLMLSKSLLEHPQKTFLPILSLRPYPKFMLALLCIRLYFLNTVFNTSCKNAKSMSTHYSTRPYFTKYWDCFTLLRILPLKIWWWHILFFWVLRGN